jgi:CheY-specific phosphatase CheX
VQSEQIAVALGDAAQTVLETMFFMMAEGEAEPMFAPDADLMRTAMTFNGHWTGTFEVRTPVACAHMIAQSFVGADDEMTPENVSEVMCELANMVCGSTLSNLANDRIFDLSKPQVCAAEEHVATANAVKVAKGLDLGGGVVAFAMSIEACR